MKERIKQTIAYKKLKRFLDRYERFLMPAMLLVGVTGDFITFRSISLKTAFILLAIHVVLVGTIIWFLNYYDEKLKEESNIAARYIRIIAPFVLQISLGALLSASFIFYWFSGSFSASWPILILLAFLMMSNDVFRHHYLKPTVQISVYFFAVFSVLSLVLPFLFNSISETIFLTGGLISLFFIFLYLRLVSKNLKNFQIIQNRIALIIGIIFISMNFLYFSNVIPPIPLSLRDAGVYHGVKRQGNDYILLAEQESFLQKIIPGQSIQIQNGNPVYVFSSIFAPSELSTKIVHDWQYYDEQQKKWISKNKLSFNISGGREDGFRGYTMKSQIPVGKWRVDVETARGQRLGRIKFNVIKSEISAELEELIK